MLSMCSVSAAQAETYYDKDDYYTQGTGPSRSEARWFGRGAGTLGLQGEVEPAVFKDLLHGQAPNGECLHARAIDPEHHRAATDYTLSAPKSVSIAGLIQEDARVIAAHNQAVDVALQVLEERFAQTRVSTPEGRQRVVTGNIVAAVFQHESSRELDPQLHSHCVVMNTTQLPDGSWRSLSNEEIVANQILLGEIYQNELAFQLRQRGYDIEPCGQGQFEIAGYGEALLETFSTRTRQIEDYLQRWQQTLDDTGGTALHASQKKQATLRTRKRKQAVPREVLIDAWQHQVKEQGLTLPEVPLQKRELSAEAQYQASQFARDGIAHASERESVFRRGKVERFAFEHALGAMPFEVLQQAIEEQGELLSVDRVKDKYTTAAALQRERETILLMHQGQNRWSPILDEAELEAQLQRWSTLTAGQRQALTQALTTTDQMSAWQGLPGSGKTFVLQAFRQSAAEQGFVIRGFAPSAEATNVLGQETGMPSATVASLVHSGKVNGENRQPEIWVIDEAGLLSARDAHAVLSLAVEHQARVILVGDTRQLSAVEAGNPFKSLQAGGIQTAFLDESRRQKTAALKQAVKQLATDQVEGAFQTLEGTGMIHDIPSSPDRLQRMAGDYLDLDMKQRDGTLLLAGTNQERLALTALIRSGLQERQQLGRDSFTLASLRRKDMTVAQAGYAAHFDIGDIVIPGQHYKRQGLTKQQTYQVVQVDTLRNRLRVADEAGRIVEINPMACEHKAVYVRQTIPIAVGDRLRWTRNDRMRNIRNGQAFTLTAINDQGQAEIAYPEGRTESVDLSGVQFADYGWVSTTYSAQGKTADRVLALMDATTSRESFYVAVSRAKYQLSLYTANRAELLRRAQRSSAKENVSDYVPLFQLVNPHGQTQKSDAPAHPSTVEHRDAVGDLGRRVGDRVAAGVATAAGADFRTASGPGPAPAAAQRPGPAPGASQPHAGAGDKRAESVAADPGDALAGLRLWQQQRQQQRVADALGHLGDSLEYLESAHQQRSRIAEAVAALARSLALQREQRRQRQRQRQQLSATLRPEQLTLAQALVPVVTHLMLLGLQANKAEAIDTETWRMAGKRYALSYHKPSVTLSLSAQDGRGELLTLQRRDGAWVPILAQGLTGRDVEKLGQAWRALTRAMQPQTVVKRQMELE
jgi:conjugative relaxase-like TrwC/TraI family protein